MEKRKSTPEGFLNHSEYSLSFCLPDYMTPSLATGVKLVRFDALSRCEAFELSQKPIVVKEADAFKMHYEDLLRQTEERSREFKMLSVDSAIINGARSRIIECELLSYGDPLKRHLTLVAIEGTDRFFTVKISCAASEFDDFKKRKDEILRSLNRNNLRNN